MISAENKPEILSSALGGTFTLPGTEVSVNRMGYGAMQLAGPGVWGPPRDAAVAVLREAVESGVNHIDTNDFYGPHVTPMQIALAWLLQRSPNILLIPGTSSLQHLRENLNAATLRLPAEAIAALNTITVIP